MDGGTEGSGEPSFCTEVLEGLTDRLVVVVVSMVGGHEVLISIARTLRVCNLSNAKGVQQRDRGSDLAGVSLCYARQK